jgi:Lipase (class 3)
MMISKTKIKTVGLYPAVFLFCAIQLTAQKKQYTYRTANDTTQNFYCSLIPEKEITGLLLILPGFGTMPEEMMLETKLPEKAVAKNYLVVIPVLDKWDTFYMDDLCMTRMDTLLAEIYSKYKIPENRFIIGGHSMGGTGAVLYAERCFQLNKKLKPSMVFGIDPPLDMKRMWKTFIRSQKIKFSEVSVNEGKFMQQYFIKKFGGSPFQKPKAYLKWSPYFNEDEKGGNAQYLTKIPVRFYCDPDINWGIENRRANLETMNLFDLTGMIVQLKLQGNTKAELITALGKGYFADGRRHPHAFSILDADEFLQWVEKK